MKRADDIKTYFKQATLSTKADRHEYVFAKIQRAQGKSLGTQPAKPELWRVFMKRRRLKVGMAAILVAALSLGMFLLQETESVAWAIEDTIEALNNYRGMLFEGSMPDEHGSVQNGQYWMMSNETMTQVQKERIVLDGIPVLVVNGEKTWRYDLETNTVIKNRPYGSPQLWMGNQMFEGFKNAEESGILTHLEMTYDQDDKQRALLKVAWVDKSWSGPRSLLFELDMDTNLPVSLKQWENANWEGSPLASVDKITYYETLPDELFDFDIPTGATVIEE
jgi:hypothetical protein